jgi:hypothetical protein
MNKYNKLPYTFTIYSISITLWYQQNNIKILYYTKSLEPTRTSNSSPAKNLQPLSQKKPFRKRPRKRPPENAPTKNVPQKTSIRKHPAKIIKPPILPDLAFEIDKEY